MKDSNSPPRSETELMSRAELLAGKTLKQVADEIGVEVPPNQDSHKGWVGRLAEIFLGANAANRSEPDFRFIGVELKTIPLGNSGRPGESTYVCTLNLTRTSGLKWEKSVVRKKLSRVLWLPVEGSGSIPLQQRRFGTALLWSPDDKQESILKNDWEEIMELVCTGDLDKVNSSLGTYLQVRPKAANARSLGKSYSNEGVMSETLPRGFYLRSSFTRTLFE